jgi:hypothetical protein
MVAVTLFDVLLVAGILEILYTGIGLYKTDPLSRTKGLAYSIIKKFLRFKTHF